MQIARVDVFGYDLTYVHGTYVMSGGREVVSLPSTVVRITADDGTEGFVLALLRGGGLQEVSLEWIVVHSRRPNVR